MHTSSQVHHSTQFISIISRHQFSLQGSLDAEQQPCLQTRLKALEQDQLIQVKLQGRLQEQDSMMMMIFLMTMTKMESPQDQATTLIPNNQPALKLNQRLNACSTLDQQFKGLQILMHIWKCQLILGQELMKQHQKANNRNRELRLSLSSQQIQDLIRMLKQPICQGQLRIKIKKLLKKYNKNQWANKEFSDRLKRDSFNLQLRLLQGLANIDQINVLPSLITKKTPISRGLLPCLYRKLAEMLMII